jgi:hypothetical protein
MKRSCVARNSLDKALCFYDRLREKIARCVMYLSQREGFSKITAPSAGLSLGVCIMLQTRHKRSRGLNAQKVQVNLPAAEM